jgi:dTDP-4-dehydrorhamnose 3,5-epimerase
MSDKKLLIIPVRPYENVHLIVPEVHMDRRGSFHESYNKKIYEQIGIKDGFVQDNFSISKKGVLRGMHYQWDRPLEKLITVVRGSVLDIITDLRHGSPTYGESAMMELSEHNKHQLWLPAGFAHGFLANEDDTTVYYKYSCYYNKHGEGVINPLDKDLSLNWRGSVPWEISERDRSGLSFEEYTKDPKFYYKEKE